MKNNWYLYMIRSNCGSLYTGITKDIDRRFSEHDSQGNKCARYLRGKAPLELVFSQSVGDKKTAYRLEYYIKKLSKAQKEQLIIDGIINSLK